MDDGNVSQIEAEFVHVILKEHFGERCAKIGMTLLERGALPLGTIGHICGYSFFQLRHCLVILLLHNVIAYESQSDIVVYTLNAKQILFRLRLPHYSRLVQRKHGTLGRILFTEMVKYGCINLRYLTKTILENQGAEDHKILAQIWEEASTAGARHTQLDPRGDLLSEEPSLTLPSRDGSSLLNEKSLKASFLKLVQDNYVIRTDYTRLHHGISSTDAVAHENSVQSKSTNKPRHGKVTKRKRAQTDPGLDVALQCMEKVKSDKRKMVKGGNLSQTKALDDCDLPFSRPTSSRFDESMVLEEFESRGVTFRINVHHLNFLLLCESAEDFMAARWGDSRIIRYITRILLQSAYQDSSGVVKAEGKTFAEISSALEELSGQEATAFHVPDSNVLLQLFDALDRTDRIIHNTTCHGVTMFIFDWTRFKNCIQDRVIFNAVTARHGIKSGRVWSLLRMSSHEITETCSPKLWEDQQVADQALLPPHTAREILYRLASSGLIRMHQSDLVSGAPPTASSKHGLLFYASLSLAKAQILKDIYTALLNLWQRKRHEALQITQFMYGHVGNGGVEESQLRYREALEDRLECSYLQLDTSILLYIRDMT